MSKGQPKGLSFPIGINVLDEGFPVLFDPHYPIMNNMPPMALITGSPGSGKTFFASWLTVLASISNKVNFVIDPKGDFNNLKKLTAMGLCNNVTIWNLINPVDNCVSDRDKGVLDPMTLLSGKNRKNDNVNLTIDMIKMLYTEKISKTQSQMLNAIVRDKANSKKQCSLTYVINAMKQSQNPEVRSMASNLSVTLETELGKLLLKPRNAKPKRFSTTKGTIIVSLLGLKLPAPSAKPETLKGPERLSMAIMYLITSLVSDMMTRLPTEIYKTLIVDEAWTILSYPEGRNMLNEVGLLGRSKNMATILVTQSPSHLREDVENISDDPSDEGSLATTISTYFTFRNNSKAENKISVKSMGLPPNEEWDETILHLGKGQCMMKDCLSNYGIIQISIPDVYAEAFNTTPTV